MVSLEENKIVSKGRLGPGQIIGIKLDKENVFHNIQIKNYLAKEYKHFNNQIIDLDKKFYVKNEKRFFFGVGALRIRTPPPLKPKPPPSNQNGGL